MSNIYELSSRIHDSIGASKTVRVVLQMTPASLSKLDVRYLVITDGSACAITYYGAITMWPSVDVVRLQEWANAKHIPNLCLYRDESRAIEMIIRAHVQRVNISATMGMHYDEEYDNPPCSYIVPHVCGHDEEHMSSTDDAGGDHADWLRCACLFC